MRFAEYRDGKIACFYTEDPRPAFPKTFIFAEVGPEAKEGDPYVASSSAVADMVTQIDDAVAAVMAKPQRFILEYQEREAQAHAFLALVAVLLPGDEVPPAPARIAAFATSAGLDPIMAAQRTVDQADVLRNALGQLADLRMRKYEVQRTQPADAQKIVFDAIMVEINRIKLLIS